MTDDQIAIQCRYNATGAALETNKISVFIITNSTKRPRVETSSMK